MSMHYPRIRIHTTRGVLRIREALSFTFYMRRDHADVAAAVMRSLETYVRLLGGSQVLGRYSEEAGAWLELDTVNWAHVQGELLHGSHAIIELRETETSSREERYRFDYQGRQLGTAPWGAEPDMVCAVNFWLPTEDLEKHGPQRVRDLALELAAPLPFCSGNVGLAFNCDTDLLGVERKVREICFRYPGMDIPDLGRHSWRLGTRVRGPSWLTFLGQPVLGELGGASGLRARLHHPETAVDEMTGDRAVVTLGPWPEAGDTEQGQELPAYQELARVLEPWLYHQKPVQGSPFTPEDLLRWERRFLD